MKHTALISFIAMVASILAPVAHSAVITEDLLKIGKPGSSAQKKLQMGTAGQGLRFDPSAAKVQFSHDGSTWSDMSAGATASSGAGLNLLTSLDNADFESGTTGWTASGGTFSATSSNPLYGAQSALWTASASAQTLSTASKAVPVGLQSKPCAVAIAYKYAGTSGDYKLQAHDGTSMIAEQSLAQSTSSKDVFLTFTCPASGSINLRIVSTVASPGQITLDGSPYSAGLAYIGSNLFETVDHVELWTSNGYGSTATRVKAYTNSSVVGSGISVSTTGPDGTTLTVQKDGKYCIKANAAANSTEAQVGIIKNASSGTKTTSPYNVTVANGRLDMDFDPARSAAVSHAKSQWCGPLVIGDYITIQGNGAAAFDASYEQVTMSRMTN